MVTQSIFHDSIKVNRIEIVRPGVAFPWKPDATGLLIETNLTVDNINNRVNSPVIFTSDAEVWSWARRISHSLQIDYPSKVTYDDSRG